MVTREDQLLLLKPCFLCSDLLVCQVVSSKHYPPVTNLNLQFDTIVTELIVFAVMLCFLLFDI